MRISLVYPVWQRIERQTHYVLPPLGVCVLAALTPPGQLSRRLEHRLPGTKSRLVEHLRDW